MFQLKLTREYLLKINGEGIALYRGLTKADNKQTYFVLTQFFNLLQLNQHEKYLETDQPTWADGSNPFDPNFLR